MSHDDESTYTDKQKRQAQHIEEGYERHGIPTPEAESRAWATVNKRSHGGKSSASGRKPSVAAHSAASITPAGKLARRRPA